MLSFSSPIRTNSGNFITAVNGGGLGGPNTGSGVVALHTDATIANTWETFQVIVADGDAGLIATDKPFSLKTASGEFVTAIYGGGVGGPNDSSCPVHTDAGAASTWEMFTFHLNPDANPPTVQIQTSGLS